MTFQLQANKYENIGASYEVIGLPEGLRYNYKFLKMIKPFTSQVDFTSYPDKVLFFGENVRGALAGMRVL